MTNAGYRVSPLARGKGVGRLDGLHSIETTPAMGYDSIQFNAVVSTNKVAIKLWKSLGFETIGVTPKGYLHAQLGVVDLLIMS